MLENIPFIGCINLKSRNDKFKHIKNQFIANNINNIHFLRVNKHPLGGTVGCYDSHLQLYKHCLKYNYEYALIFEDDIIINSKNIKNILNKFFYIKKKYPLWYKINCHNWGIISFKCKIKDGIYMANGVGNMCYFISRRAMQKTFETHITQNHIDLQQYFDFPSNQVFYITPSLAKICPMSSDNEDYGDWFLGKIAFYLQNKTTLLQTTSQLLCLKFPQLYTKIINIMHIRNNLLNQYKKRNVKLNIKLNKDKILILKY